MATLLELQKEIEMFDQERNWEKSSKHLKDFLLNMCEEVGEAWSIIKWVDHQTQEDIIKQYKAEFKDFVGDQLFLILKIAYLLDINSEEALQETLAEYRDRFPVKEMLEKKHGNPLAGGVDHKRTV